MSINVLCEEKYDVTKDFHGDVKGNVKSIYPTLLSHTPERYPTLPVMGENSHSHCLTIKNLWCRHIFLLSSTWIKFSVKTRWFHAFSENYGRYVPCWMRTSHSRGWISWSGIRQVSSLTKIFDLRMRVQHSTLILMMDFINLIFSFGNWHFPLF